MGGHCPPLDPPLLTIQVTAEHFLTKSKACDHLFSSEEICYCAAMYTNKGVTQYGNYLTS